MDARALLESSLAEPPNLATLSAAAGVHRSQLARAFRAHFGCSVGDFVRRQRLMIALREITAGGQPLAAIAAVCGFSDQSHLTRLVRAVTGQTPGRLRRRGRGASRP